MTVPPIVDTTVATSSAAEVEVLLGDGVYVPIGVSRTFILSYTGIAEPSDKECQEGSHSVCANETYESQLLKYSIMPKFIIDINPYFVGGHVDTTRLIADIIPNAMPIKKLKFMDFIDAGNGVYAFLHEGEIIYIGKCSSRSFCERISSHISKSPHGYMNNVMKKIAWFCSSKNLSKDEFLADTNEPDRTDSFRKAEKIMKDLKIVCISFEAFSSSTKKKEICQLEKELINSLNPLLNRRILSLSSFRKTSTLFFKTITK